MYFYDVCDVINVLKRRENNEMVNRN